jgi:DNA-3-methyladenine glycosylase
MRGPVTDAAALLAYPPDEVAPRILGWRLFVTDAATGITVGGPIVEAEAYLAEGDPAAHNRRGRTAANASQFGPAGTLYVHPMRQHVLIDIVTEGPGRPGSVLLRALDPSDGVELMCRRRGLRDVQRLCRGPGNLGRALGITRAFDGLDILAEGSPVRLLPPVEPLPPHSIAASARIGVGTDLPRPLRFFVEGSPHVSRSSGRSPERTPPAPTRPGSRRTGSARRPSVGSGR